jgi:hypothetical protein
MQSTIVRITVPSWLMMRGMIRVKAVNPPMDFFKGIVAIYWRYTGPVLSGCGEAGSGTGKRLIHCGSFQENYGRVV